MENDDTNTLTILKQFCLITVVYLPTSEDI